MAKTKKKEEVSQAIVVAAPKRELVLEGDPEQQLEFARKAAKALMSVVSQKPKKVILNGKQYLEYGDWQTLARFYGCTASIAWTKEYQEDGKKVGWEARAEVFRQGEMISSAEAMCLESERNWKERKTRNGVEKVPDFQRRSMAQTRAAAKALRNALGWVAELAGYAYTPAEEMTYDQTPIPAKAVPKVYGVEEEIPNDPIEQKRIIISFVKQLSPKLNWKDEETVIRFIEDITKLKVTPKSFPAIIRALENEVQYRNM